MGKTGNHFGLQANYFSQKHLLSTVDPRISRIPSISKKKMIWQNALTNAIKKKWHGNCGLLFRVVRTSRVGIFRTKIENLKGIKTFSRLKRILTTYEQDSSFSRFQLI